MNGLVGVINQFRQDVSVFGCADAAASMNFFVVTQGFIFGLIDYGLISISQCVFSLTSTFYTFSSYEAEAARVVEATHPSVLLKQHSLAFKLLKNSPTRNRLEVNNGYLIFIGA